jgi:nitrogen regulatory protein PII
MKKIEAIIKEEQLNPVKTALESAGFVGMTIYSAKGRGSSGGIKLEWRAGSYTVDFLNRIIVMLVVPEVECDAALQALKQACGSEGGTIITSPVDSVIRLGSH